MKFPTRKIIKCVYILIDVVCICSTFLLVSVLLEGKLSFDVTFENMFLNDVNPFRYVLLIWILALLVTLNSYNLYQTRRELLEGIELWAVMKAVAVSALAMVVGIYILKVHGFPRSIFAASAAGLIIVLFTWRALKRVFVIHLVASGYNNLNVLIIGAGKIGQELEREIRERPTLGLRILGYLDDFKTNDDISSETEIIGKLSEFEYIARTEFIHKVFITIHHDSQIFLRLLEKSKEMDIAVEVIPQGFEFTSGEFFKYNIGLIPVLEYGGLSTAKRQFGKRLFDFVCSSVSTLILLPFFILLGILIKLDSPGPVLYVSRRYGKRGNIFNMYKFRSMIQHAEKDIDSLKEHNEVDGPIFKMKRDPRITEMGRFLRRYSLDELPQIINVLKGEMSIVGPRPLPIDQIEKEDLQQLKRLEVRPGITGLWQVRGRSDLSFKKLVKWDVWYINNWSFWLDLNILFQTIPVVLRGKGAY